MHYYLYFNSLKGTLASADSDYSVIEKDGYQIAIYGDVWINDKHNDIDTILYYYHNCQDNIINHIEGLYYLFIYNSKNNTLDIFQDLFTGSEVLYYTQTQHIYHFSNTLHGLREASGMNFSICPKSRIQFAKYGFVPGAATLIENVHKIAPRHKLVIENGIAIQKSVDYQFHLQETEAAESRWNEQLGRAIDMNSKDLPHFSMPLSSGYDSNYILHHLNSKNNQEIDLYTIGGRTGMDESASARKIAKYYGKHHLTTAFTSSSMINDLPDIVWRLGGTVFERGIFLQYRLGKELARNQETHLICGECADQVMHLNFLRDFMDSSAENCVGKENVYDFLSYIILKKSGILLNSFGVKGIYPFSNQKLLDIAISLRHKNQTDKKFHKRNCKEQLPAEVSKIIHKEGGATSFHSLFANEEDAQKLCDTIETTSLYQEITSHTPILPRFQKPSMKQLLMLIASHPSEYWTAFWGRAESHSLKTLLPSFQKTEKRIRNCLLVLYLAIFEELYCSDRSEQYQKEGIEVFHLESFLSVIPNA